MRKIFFYAIIILIASCQKPQKNIFEISSDITINYNEKWKKVSIATIDSQTFCFVNKRKDSIFLEFGKLAPKMDNAINVVNINRKKELDSLGFPTDEMYFSRTPSLDENQGVFHKEYYYYKKLGGKVCKIQMPKIIGEGNCKLFVELENGNNFSVWSSSPDYEGKEEFLNFLEFIEFKK